MKSKKMVSLLLSGAMAAALLAAPAHAAGSSAIRLGSYKGNDLEVGERSGLIIGVAAQAVTSASPEIVSVENVNGFWVAVAKADGTAVLTATDIHGETATLTLTVGDPTPADSQATIAPAITELDEVRQEIVRLVNEVRREHGVQELAVNDSLMAAAQERAETMYTYHNSKEDCEAALAHGYPHGFGANITAFTGTATADAARRAVSNWVNSPGHFHTMIDPDCNTIGVGVAEDESKTVCYLFVGNPKAVNPY